MCRSDNADFYEPEWGFDECNSSDGYSEEDNSDNINDEEWLNNAD